MSFIFQRRKILNPLTKRQFRQQVWEVTQCLDVSKESSVSETSRTVHTETIRHTPQALNLQWYRPVDIKSRMNTICWQKNFLLRMITSC